MALTTFSLDCRNCNDRLETTDTTRALAWIGAHTHGGQP